MNDYFKKNINKIIGVFLLLQPFLDLLTGICIHRFNLNITIGIVVRIIFLLFICFVVIFIFKKKKVIIPYLIIGLYFIFYFIGLKIYKDTIYLSEIQNLIKVFYFPILLISLYSIKDEIRISNLTFFTIIFFYLILIFVPILLDVGYKSYEITKSGTLGFFNSANEISGIISILTPFLFIVFYESKRIVPIIILTIMYLVVVLTMGTKTPILSLGITSLISIVYFWIYLFKNKKYKIIITSFLVVLISCIGLVLIIPKTSFYKNIRVHLDFLEVDHITDVFKDKKLIDHFIFSSRIKFLKNKSKIYHKSSTYERIFGIGYINNNKNTKLIEMDYYDIIYSHGIVGFLIFIMIIIYILYKTLNRKKGYEQLMKYTSLFFILFLSLLTGHIITAPSVSLLSILIIISLAKRTKKDILLYSRSINNIEKEHKDLIDKLDYNKYKITIFLESSIPNNLNKNVIVKNVKYNKIQLLVFKILNYHNYDFSYNLTSNNIADYIVMNASYNNAILVKKDVNTKYKYLVFKRKEEKKEFEKEYPGLKEKTVLLNDIIDIK